MLPEILEGDEVDASVGHVSAVVVSSVVVVSVVWLDPTVESAGDFQTKVNLVQLVLSLLSLMPTHFH